MTDFSVSASLTIRAGVRRSCSQHASASAGFGSCLRPPPNCLATGLHTCLVLAGCLPALAPLCSPFQPLPFLSLASLEQRHPQPPPHSVLIPFVIAASPLYLAEFGTRRMLEFNWPNHLSVQRKLGEAGLGVRSRSSVEGWTQAELEPRIRIPWASPLDLVAQQVLKQQQQR